MMDIDMWPHRPPPSSEGRLWDWTILSAGELHALRAEVRARLYLAPGHLPLEPVDERLILAVDELVSHGLRHGDGPVRVRMTETAAGWLIEVSEPVAGEDSQAVVDQDSVLPDLGLQLVVQMTSGRGWTVAEDRTHMWAHVTVG
jgi:hypothetical protein